MELARIQNKPNPSGIVVLVVLLLTLIGVSGLIFKGLIGKKQTPSSSPQVATDPSFTEVKGQVLPGFPSFPVYPGATLVASAKTSPEGVENQGFRVKWSAGDSVPRVMAWYQVELPKTGWRIEKTDDPDNLGEQVVQISSDGFNGNIAIETSQGNIIEIIVDIRIN